MSLRKSATINSFAAIAYQIITIVVGFIIPKLYTETFGSTYNGLNQTVLQIMKFLAVLQAGLSAASIQALFKPVANDNKNEIIAIYKHTEKQYRIMGYAFISILTCITILWMLLSSEDISKNLIFIFMLSYGFSASLEYFFQAKYNVILTSYNKVSVIYYVSIVLFIVSTLMKVFTLIYVKDIVVYLLILIFISILRVYIMKTYIKKNYPFLDYHEDEIIKKNIEIKNRKDVLVSEIAGLVISSTDLIIINITSGLIFASIYSIYFMVVSAISNIMASINAGFFPGLGQLYNKNRKKFFSTYDRFETLFLWLGFILFSITIILYMPFIKLYTKNMDVNYVYKFLPLLFVLIKMLLLIRIPSTIIVKITGLFKEVKKYSIYEAIANLILSIILGNIYGIYGILLGTIIGSFFRTPAIINIVNKTVLSRKNMVYVKKLLLLGLPFLGAIIFSFTNFIQANNFYEWLCSAVIVIIFIALINIIWLYILDRKLVIYLIKNIKAKIKFIN